VLVHRIRFEVDKCPPVFSVSSLVGLNFGILIWGIDLEERKKAILYTKMKK
jgi:hypothetical protein